MADHQQFSTRHETVLELAADLDSGAETAVSLCQRSLERIRASQDTLHAFITVDEHGALEQARRLDEERANGISRGRLHGIPIGIKDSIPTAGMRTTFNSRSFADWVPAIDNPGVARLRDAGAVIIGKTTVNEFAFSEPSENDMFPPARNPWFLDELAPLSTSGSSTAVAAGLVPVALGSDGGGSTRIPASDLGLVGLKVSATVGSEIEWETIQSLRLPNSSAGVVAHTAADARLVAAALNPATCDPADRITSLDGVTFGVPRFVAAAGCDPEVIDHFEESRSVLRSLGATIVDVDVPSWPMAALANFLTLYSARAATIGWLAERDESLLGASMRRRVLAATFLNSADVKQCHLVRLAFQRELRQAMELEGLEALLLPVSPTERIGYDPRDGNPIYDRAAFTAPGNLAGWAALAVPAGFVRPGRPLGVQIMAPAPHDGRLLDIASQLMHANGWDVGARIGTGWDGAANYTSVTV